MSWRGAVTLAAACAVVFAAPMALADGFPPAVEACLVQKLGAGVVAEIRTERAPTAAESSAVGACYSQAASGGQAGGADPSGGGQAKQAGGAITPAVLACVKRKLGAKVATAITTTRAPTAIEAQIIGACADTVAAPAHAQQSKSKTGQATQAGGAITAGVLACVKKKLGAKVATAITTTRSPTAAEAAVIGACSDKAAAPANAAQTKSKTGQATQAGDGLSPAVLACVKAKLGAKVATAITTTRGPNTAEAKVIVSCGDKTAALAHTAQSKTEAAPPGTKVQPAKAAAKAGAGCLSAAALVERAVATDHEWPIPTAAEIACNAKKAKRRALPAVVVTAGGAVLPSPDHPILGPHWQKGSLAAAVWALRSVDQKDGFPSNLSTPSRLGLPPYIPLVTDRTALAESLRLYQAVVLAEKAAGKPVQFSFMIAGPGEWEPTFPQTEASFRAWVEKEAKPQIAAVAKAAEEVKAEVLVVPFWREPDILLNFGKLRQLPAATRVELAQLLVSAGADAARPHFKGVLAGWRGWQFHAPTEEKRAFFAAAPMEQVRYDAYDIVLSTFVAVSAEGCTASYVKEFMGVQLAKTVELATRDGVRWAIGELDMFTEGSISDYADCGVTDLRAEFDAVVGVITDALVAVRPRPAMVGMGTGPAEWSNDAALRKRLAKRLTAFATALKQG